ncbi:hypothetical protein OB236_09975 [Paenibacillus sp. WQ 127069]|uniref:Uncharacterized protein n=1 Tax=Paenibacillus baimaensis TaxID=2982185 RepID=A0ABT2UCU4_9BACL|nr:hypothetical protein [Paenibacillus sp. WQ 127069]
MREVNVLPFAIREFAKCCDWLKKILLQRFDELSEAVEHLPQIVDLRMGRGLFMEVG